MRGPSALQIGNEEGIDPSYQPLHGYRDHFDLVAGAVRKRYPDVEVIASGACSWSATPGPPAGSAQPPPFCMNSSAGLTLWDTHYYGTVEGMIAMNSTFDYFPRQDLPPIIVGEYSAGNDNVPGASEPPYMTLRAALAEAMFMVNFEENADVVKASSYAPMMMRWLPDGVMPMSLIPCQIVFNSSTLFLAPSYFVQRMFRDALLDTTINVTQLHAGSPSQSIAKAVASVGSAENGSQNASVKIM